MALFDKFRGTLSFKPIAFDPEWYILLCMYTKPIKGDKPSFIRSNGMLTNFHP